MLRGRVTSFVAFKFGYITASDGKRYYVDVNGLIPPLATLAPNDDVEITSWHESSSGRVAVGVRRTGASGCLVNGGSKPARVYQATRLDIAQLRETAALVARALSIRRPDTDAARAVARPPRRLFGPRKSRQPTPEDPARKRWILMSRYYVREEKGGGKLREERQDFKYLLVSNGALRVETVEGLEIIRGRALEHRHEEAPSQREMTEEDMLLFDYEPGYYSHEGQVSVWRTDVRGALRADRKGSGLLSALEGLS